MFQPDAREKSKSNWIIAGVLIGVTVATVLVVWVFITSLEDNSKRMSVLRTAHEEMTQKSQFLKYIDQTPGIKHEGLKENTFKHSTELYDQAQEIASSGKYESARNLGRESITEMQKEIAGGEKNAESDRFLSGRYGFVGLMSLKMKDNTQAVDDFTHAIELNPKQPWYFNRRADAYFNLHKLLISGEDRRQGQILESQLSKGERAMRRLMDGPLDGE